MHAQAYLPSPPEKILAVPWISAPVFPIRVPYYYTRTHCKKPEESPVSCATISACISCHSAEII